MVHEHWNLRAKIRTGSVHLRQLLRPTQLRGRNTTIENFDVRKIALKGDLAPGEEFDTSAGRAFL